MKLILLVLVGLAIVLPSSDASFALNPLFYQFFRIPPYAHIQITPFGGVRHFWRRSTEQEVDKQIRCTFEKEKLKCEAEEEKIECDAAAINHTIRNETFSSFAISAEWNTSDAKSIEKFSLHPQRAQSSSWKHPKVKDAQTNAIYEFSLFFSEKLTHSGLRVKHEECWRRLVDFITKRSSSKIVKIGKNDDARIVGIITMPKNI